LSGDIIELDPTFIDRLAVPAGVCDTAGRFLHANAAAEQGSGRTIGELRHKHVTEIAPAETHEHVLTQFRRAVDGDAADFETVFLDGRGNLHGLRAIFLPIIGKGGVSAVLGLGFSAPDVPADPLPYEQLPRLTRRQREILELIAAGHSTEQIASQLTLSTETVRNHVRGMLRALGARTRVEAVAVARRFGYLAPPLRRD